jgi:hypothetical protein
VTNGKVRCYSSTCLDCMESILLVKRQQSISNLGSIDCNLFHFVYLGFADQNVRSFAQVTSATFLVKMVLGFVP